MLPSTSTTPSPWTPPPLLTAAGAGGIAVTPLPARLQSASATTIVPDGVEVQSTPTLARERLAPPPLVPPKPLSWMERAHELLTGARNLANRVPVYATHALSEAVTNPGDFFANNAKGVARGALIVPDRAIPDPKNPDAAVQAVGAAVGMIGEAVGGESVLARGLTYLAAKGVPGAARALRLFDAGEGASMARRAFGAGAQSVTAEAISQEAAVAYGDQTQAEATRNLRPVALAAGALTAGAAAPRAVGATVRRSPALQRIVEGVGDVFRDRFIVHHRMRKYRGLEDAPDWTMQSEFMAHKHARNSVGRAAINKVRDMLAPIAESSDVNDVLGKRTYDGALQDEFVELVRGNSELLHAEHLGVDLPEERVDELWTKYNNADPAVREAFDRHRELLERVQAELLRVGRDSSTPFNLGGLGNPKSFYGYADQAMRAEVFFERSQVDEEFLGRVFAAQGRPLAAFSDEERAALLAGHTVQGADGVAVRAVEPKALGASGSRAFDALIDASVRSQGLVSNPSRMALPADIVDELLKQGIGTKPSSKIAKYIEKGTVAWKTGTMVAGAFDMALKNFFGDAAATFRSFPGIVKDREAFARALDTQRRFYGFGRPVEEVEHAVIRGRKVRAVSPERLIHAAVGFAAGGGLTAADGETNLPEFLIGGTVGAVGALGFRMGTEMVRNRRLNASVEGLYEESRLARDEMLKLEKLGVANSGFVGGELNLGGNSRLLNAFGHDFDTTIAQDVRSFGKMWGDTIATIVLGQKVGRPFVGEEGIDAINTLMLERENLLRMAAFYHQVQQGVPELVAAKRAREALVDYEKFTEFETRWLRGFVLPFYSFARHSVPNWIRAAVGRDVGGNGAAALAATAGLASFDVASQAWNELFEEEDALDANAREHAHIIAGWPKALGGVGALKDAKGRTIRISLDMPYELPMELLGLARPGVLAAQLFGEMDEGNSLVARWQRKEDFEALPEAGKAVFHATAEEVRHLLSPAITLPVEALTGHSFAWGTPVVEEWKDESARQQWLDHVAEMLLPVVREWREANHSQVISVGMSDPDFTMKHRLADLMETAQYGEPKTPLQHAITDVVHGVGAGAMSSEMMAQVHELILAHAEMPQEAEAMKRYYAQQTVRRSDLGRQWASMDAEARATFLKMLNPFEKAALTQYLAGRNVFAKEAGEATN